MAALKRVGLSFASVVISVVAISVCLSFDCRVSTWSDSLLADLIGIGIFSLPGWLLAIPFVLIAKRFDHWRFWAWLAAGTAIGPTLVLILFLITMLQNHNRSLDWNGVMILLALGTSFSTTLIYLLLARKLPGIQDENKAWDSGSA